jgi:hypothetical protein
MWIRRATATATPLPCKSQKQFITQMLTAPVRHAMLRTGPISGMSLERGLPKAERSCVSQPQSRREEVQR